MKNIIVFASGNGSNLQRIIDCIESDVIKNTQIKMVITDRDCYALQRAKNHHIPHFLIKKDKYYFENLNLKISEIFNDFSIDLIVLAGFLSILNSDFCLKYNNKIINIHPSLLPKYGGKGMWGHHVHQAVLNAKEIESGATVHFVTSGIDEGKIILQKMFDISENETLETITEKVHQIEFEILPIAINLVLNSSPL